MRAFVLLSLVALAAVAPKKLSSKFLSTPMARGGGRIVGGEEATVCMIFLCSFNKNHISTFNQLLTKLFANMLAFI